LQQRVEFMIQRLMGASVSKAKPSFLELAIRGKKIGQDF